MLSLSLLLSITVILRDCSSFIAARLNDSLLTGARKSHGDAESLLAQGRRLPLLCSAAEDLELLPGVTERVAGELLAAATELARIAPSVGEQDALLEVHGIGPRRAPFFARHLDLGQTCERRQGEAAPPAAFGAN